MNSRRIGFIVGGVILSAIITGATMVASKMTMIPRSTPDTSIDRAISLQKQRIDALQDQIKALRESNRQLNEFVLKMNDGQNIIREKEIESIQNILRVVEVHRQLLNIHSERLGK